MVYINNLQSSDFVEKSCKRSDKSWLNIFGILKIFFFLLFLKAISRQDIGDHGSPQNPFFIIYELPWPIEKDSEVHSCCIHGFEFIVVLFLDWLPANAAESRLLFNPLLWEMDPCISQNH